MKKRISLLFLMFLIMISVLVGFTCNRKGNSEVMIDKKDTKLLTGITYGVHIDLQNITLKDLENIAKLGFRYVRADILWEYYEKEDGSYNFSSFDFFMEQLQELGLKAIIIIAYSHPNYEKTDSVVTAKGRAAFAKYAATVAKRYQKYEVVWEIWNEPDSPAFWKPAPNPADYMKLLQKAIVAIKQADPQALCIGPAVVGMPEELWREYFQRELVKYVDAVSVHLYRDVMPETAGELDIKPIRRLIAEYTKNKEVPLVCSEWGYSNVEKIINEEIQGALMVRILLTNTYAGLPITILYNWKNNGNDPHEPEFNFGLLDHQGNPKKAYYMVKEFFEELSGYQYYRRLESEAKDYLLVFKKQSSYKLVAWTSEKTLAAHEVSLKEGTKLRINYKPIYRSLSRAELKKLL